MCHITVLIFTKFILNNKYNKISFINSFPLISNANNWVSTFWFFISFVLMFAYFGYVSFIWMRNTCLKPMNNAVIIINWIGIKRKTKKVQKLDANATNDEFPHCTSTTIAFHTQPIHPIKLNGNSAATGYEYYSWL